ncbi:MAG: hypothetical protein K8F52_01230 [Candidatus Scalindua rubra]|nr:hypothetical protein [Candidatus Scalindua rubra]
MISDGSINLVCCRKHMKLYIEEIKTKNRNLNVKKFECNTNSR